MPEVIIAPSVAQTEAILLPYGAEHRLTVVCGLIAPATGEIALVQTVKSAHEDPLSMGLKMPQGGVRPGESLAEAYLRELTEEAGIQPDDIKEIHGVPLDPPHTGGRSRGGKPGKAFGLLYGIAHGKPELRPKQDEIATAAWRPLRETEVIFSTQRAHPEYSERGRRSMQMFDGIIAHVVLTQDKPLQP